MRSPARQVLELKYKRKHVPKEVTKLHLRLYPLTLEKIWTNASKELNQIKVDFGDAERKEACARALLLTIFQTKKPAISLAVKVFVAENCLSKDGERFRIKRNCSIWELNDSLGWSFSDFAKKLRSLDCNFP
jgi:hypothetical protein